MAVHVMILFSFILIYPVLIISSLTEYVVRRYDQYEKSEILEHEDHRDILNDMKTIFVPEMVIFFKHPLQATRDKRNYECRIFGSKLKYCYRKEDNYDYRNMDEEKFNLSITSSTLPSVPDVKNASDVDHVDSEGDNSIIVVKVNISRFDPDLLLSRNTDKNAHCNTVDGNDEEQIFWNYQMKKEDIRKLQSKTI